jgi:ribosomal protein S18 acetylase RimI-like enzyme
MTVDALEIRPFQAGDRAEVIALWAEVFADDPPANAPARMIDIKLRVQPELFLVGLVDGALVATVLAGFDGVRGWIHRLAVQPRCRRQAIGTQMMRAAEAGLHGLGCPKINLQVRSTNAAVVAFYESLGYATEDRISLGRVLPSTKA